MHPEATELQHRPPATRVAVALLVTVAAVVGWTGIGVGWATAVVAVLITLEIRRVLVGSSAHWSAALVAVASASCVAAGALGHLELVPFVLAIVAMLTFTLRIVEIERGVAEPEGATDLLAGNVAAVTIGGALLAHTLPLSTLGIDHAALRWFTVIVLASGLLSAAVDRTIGKRPIGDGTRTVEGIFSGFVGASVAAWATVALVEPNPGVVGAITVGAVTGFACALANLASAALTNRSSSPALFFEIFDVAAVGAPVFYWVARTFLV